VARKKTVRKKARTKTVEGLSKRYLATHVPDREFNERDFERVGELATFGWNVMRKIVDAATNSKGVEQTKGPAKLTVTIKFTVEPVEVRQPDDTVTPMCIGASIVGGLPLSGPGGGHQPCILVDKAGVAYVRHESGHDHTAGARRKAR